MQDQKSILFTYAASLSPSAGLESPEQRARSLGWIDATGAVTKTGRETARAFIEQEKTRSAFRIG